MTNKKLALRGKGRPSEYTDELADDICQLIIQGHSVRKIADTDVMPTESTIYLWLSKFPYFSEKYGAAVQHRTNKYMEECVDLSDNMPDGIKFMGLDGRLYERDEVLQLTVQERAMAQLVPIGLSNELINKRKLQIDTRLKASAQMHPRKYGSKTDLTTNGKDIKGVTVVVATQEDKERLEKL